MAASLDPQAFQLGGQFNGDAAQLQQKQMLTQMLMKLAEQQPQQGQMVSGHYVSASPLAGLGQGLAMYLGMKGQKDLVKDQTDLSAKYQQALAQAMSGYMQGRNGTPAVPGQTLTTEQAGNLMNNDVAPPQLTEPQPGTPGDPRRAAYTGSVSPFPQVQGVAKADLEALNKAMLTPGQVLSAPGFSGPSRVAAATTPGGVDPTKLQPETFDAPGAVARGPNGEPIMGQRDSVTGKVTFAPQGTNVNLNTQQTANEKFAGNLAEGRAKELITSKENVMAAIPKLEGLQQASKALEEGMKSGISGDMGLALAKAGKALGLNDADPSIANTEQYRAQLAQTVLASIKPLGTGSGVSDKDREYAEKAAGGAISLDDNTMRRVLMIGQQAAANTILNHQELVNKNRKASGALGADLDTMEVPYEFTLPPELKFNTRTGRVMLPPLTQVNNSTKKGTATSPIPLADYLQGVR